MFDSSIRRIAESKSFPWICAAFLAAGSALLTAIGGEAGGDHPSAWFGVLAALSVVWLASLGSKSATPAMVLGTALAIRLAMLFMPTGSDAFRYVWEGGVLSAGFNPYVHPPDDAALAFLRDEVWNSVSHPGATAIYPPLAQWIFAGLAAAGLGPLGFKLVFTAADLLVCGLLVSRLGPRAAVVYAWNPLAAVSFAGGGHYDSLFMLAMVLAWLSWDRENGPLVRTAMLLGAAVALKWMALPLGLWLFVREWRNHGPRRGFLTAVVLALPVTAGWAAVCGWSGEWTLQLMPSGFSRSARSAELIPAIADMVFRTGHLDNRWFLLLLIPAWGLVAVRNRSFVPALEWSFFATYVLSPMLHAWYFAWILPFAAITRNPGSIALGATGTAYFLVHHTLAQPGGTWTFTWWQRGLIWLPFVIGFLVHRLKPGRDSTR